MRFSTVSSLALLGAATVSAIGELGFNIGVKNNDGTCKSTSDYLNDFNTLKEYTSIVKVYAASDCNTLQNLGPAAEQAGFTVFVGVWPTDDAHYEAEKQALQDYLPNIKTSTVQGILVGSEALYRGDLTASELADKIDDVRSLVKGLKDSDGNSYGNTQVGTVDSWNVLVDGANLAAIQASDMVFANAFSYWQGQTMQNASYSFFDDIMQAMQTIQTAKGSDVNFWVGETGWPSEGTNFESSYPSTTNAAQFWQQGICALRAWGVNVLVFEAFDEDWKPNTSGTSDVEKHWGVWTSGDSLKYSLNCDFSS
ncbi:LAMI_0F16138g1_1 [Lachancea mirantina]|uniref:glucan 1,3-beta-glucosidase n=1 Tax=Lachancea mirantina TaxID=1230905 RepID=A0A1G4K504_9SACH|nr:LAMI_0F16138g1_1 [Lachancea mirantina]